MVDSGVIDSKWPAASLNFASDQSTRSLSVGKHGIVSLPDTIDPYILLSKIRSFSFGFRAPVARRDASSELDAAPRSALATSATHNAISGVAVLSGKPRDLAIDYTVSG